MKHHHPPHHGPEDPHRPHHEHRHPAPPHPAVEELRMLARYGRLQRLEEVFDYLARRLGTDIAGRMRDDIAATGSQSIDKALDYIDAVLKLLADGNWQKLLASAGDKRIAAVFPLPPHIHEDLLKLPGVSILLPDGHPFHPELQHTTAPVIEGTRSCRRAIREFDLVFAESYRDDGMFVGDVEVVDVVDSDCVAPGAAVKLHLRPHRHPDDVAFTIQGDRLQLI